MSKILKNAYEIISKSGQLSKQIIGGVTVLTTLHYASEIVKARKRNKIVIDSEILEVAKEFKKKMKETGVENIDIMEVAKDLQKNKNETIQYNEEYKRRSSND